MRRSTSRPDDHALAATAVNALAALAERKRASRSYEIIAFVRDGAKAIETMVIPEQRTARKTT